MMQKTRQPARKPRFKPAQTNKKNTSEKQTVEIADVVMKEKETGRAGKGSGWE